MLHYFKFRQEFFDPAPAREVYQKRSAGKGWPEECPPIRSANAFGYDILANFDVTFIQEKGRWRVMKDVIVESDFNYAGDDEVSGEASGAASDESSGAPLTQQYAWFWERGQKLPHPISDNVYRQISNQVKISSFLFLQTDPNELLLMTEIPNLHRPWKAMSALIETDWYPASYPWHAVIELDRSQKRIAIKKGEPICRLIPVRRDAYFAKAMSPAMFDEFFARGQQWLATHGKFEHESTGGAVDITRTYVRQQVKSKFIVMD